MKILIFGNSGSGKSTLALELSRKHSIAHLDLDSVAWLPVSPPKRMPLGDVKPQIEEFVKSNTSWIIEGCYTDLLELVTADATEIIYLNLPIELCIKNARNRPWEPHKYTSKELQNNNLPMLINWISQYETRNDTFSQTSHLKLFDIFTGNKTMYLDNSYQT